MYRKVCVPYKALILAQLENEIDNSLFGIFCSNKKNSSGTHLNKTITIIARLLLKHLLGYICRSYDDKTSVIMLWSMMPHIMTRLSPLRPLYCTLVPLFPCPLLPSSLLHIPELSRRNKSYVEYANSKGECSR